MELDVSNLIRGGVEDIGYKTKLTYSIQFENAKTIAQVIEQLKKYPNHAVRILEPVGFKQSPNLDREEKTKEVASFLSTYLKNCAQ